MSAERQKNQLELALAASGRGEAPKTPAVQGTEASMAEGGDESPGGTQRLMEEVCERENLKEALRRVRTNGGSPGVDGMRVEEVGSYLKDNWPKIREQLLSGTYQPQPVRRVEIPKPDGGTRKLGIPTVLDRLVQQAVLQVLQGRWDRTFCEQSYGFRPKRSAHQAVGKAQQYVAEGNRWVVDIDLEKFFDRVNHDMLMGRVAKRESDKRLLKLIRAFLNAGVMENGLVGPTDEGTPQGGPLSPPAVEPRAGRSGPGAGATRPSIRTLRRRLQHLCPKRAGGEAGDGECGQLHHEEAQAEGERREERGGQAVGAEVSGL